MAVEILSATGSLETQMAEAAKNIFALLGVRSAHEPLVLGLCGGRSVVGLLQAMLDESRNQPQDIMRRIQFFMADERVVPLSDSQSNFGGIKTQLFDKLLRDGLISEDQLHPFEASHSDAESACEAYENELKRYGGSFAVTVLGMGEDGHVAGLFPNHRVLSQTGRAFYSFEDSPKPPPHRMTASMSLVCHSSLVVLLALGEAKREAWNKFREPSVSVSDCPAKMVAQASRCVVVTDLER
jgi:6-phosphogluconolactonase